jgi:hypothetical protein
MSSSRNIPVLDDQPLSKSEELYLKFAVDSLLYLVHLS